MLLALPLGFSVFKATVCIWWKIIEHIQKPCVEVIYYMHIYCLIFICNRANLFIMRKYELLN